MSDFQYVNGGIDVVSASEMGEEFTLGHIKFPTELILLD